MKNVVNFGTSCQGYLNLNARLFGLIYQPFITLTYDLALAACFTHSSHVSTHNCIFPLAAELTKYAVGLMRTLVLLIHVHS